MDGTLLKAIITVAFGAVAGGLTNTLAIWMLFHPHRPPKILGRRPRWLHGAIPRNQARLASTIGRTVGTKLLTRDDLVGVLGCGAFRSTFDERLTRFLNDALEGERGSIRDLLGPDVMQEVSDIAEAVLEHCIARVDEYLASDAFEDSVRSRAHGLAAHLADQPVSDILTPKRGVAISKALDSWIDRVTAEDGFRDAVARYVRQASEQLLAPEVTFRDILPEGAVGTLERAVAGYVPLAIGRLGTVLERPEPRVRFESAIQDLLHRFLRDLKFHQRVVARLVMTEDAVARVLDTFEEEGAARIGELFRDPTVRGAMATGINDAISDFMDRPVRSVLGDPDDPEVQGAQDAIVSWAVDLARSSAARTFVATRIESAVARASERTWGQVLDGIPPRRASKWLVRGARSETVQAIYREGARRIIAAALERPIGRPARWLPAGTTDRLQQVASPALWAWLQDQVPALVQRLDVAQRVEQKVLDFPVADLEDLVRRVTHRELRVIVYLGYGLGTAIGLGLVLVNYLLG